MTKLVRLAVLAILLCLSLPFATAQVVRDRNALRILQDSAAAMGELPSDFRANGTMERSAGGLDQQGTIRFLARGLKQSAEYVTVDGLETAIVHSLTGASKGIAGAQKRLPLEGACTSNSPFLVLQWVASVVGDNDTSIELIATEQTETASQYRIRVMPYASGLPLPHLASLCSKEIWIDTTTKLPTRVAFSFVEAAGAVPRVRYELYYDRYELKGTTRYPAAIRRWFNGLLYESITITAAETNVGLTDADFAITQ